MRQTQRIRRTREQGMRARSRGRRGRYARQWQTREQHLPPPAYASLDEVPRDMYDRAVRDKLMWIQRFVNEGCPRGKLMEYARAHARAHDIPEEKIPPYTTLNTWVHRYHAYGLLGLVDAVRRDAGRRRSMSGRVAWAVGVLRFGGKKNPAAALKELARFFDEDDLPHYATIRREIRRLERDDPHLASLCDSEGLAGWRNHFRLALAGENHPGGAVLAIDSTVADIWVRVLDTDAPSGWKAVRPVFTVVEDVGSRMLVTFNFSFAAVDAGILMGIFRRAVFPDANYPGLISPGVPRSVIVDRGAENQGDFLALLQRHGVEVRSGPGNTPELNGRAERLIRTIQESVFAGMPGYSKLHRRFDPYAPAEKEAKRRLSQVKYEPYRLELDIGSLPRIEEVETAVLAWAHVYNARPHPGLPVDSPDLLRVLAQAEMFDGNTGDGDDD